MLTPTKSRREAIATVLKAAIASHLLPPGMAAPPSNAALRAVNIMNFIRAEEPREKMDLIEPVREQMALIRAHRFPATWLLQYDALVEGPFVEFLRSQAPPEHEMGVWFEMNRRICDDAGIAWRGRPDWEWDYHVPVAYPIGYTPDERRRLADTAMATFQRVFGRPAKSVASWNLDAITCAHLADHHHVDAFANCRDQLATDGFTIWGSPIAAYYPSRRNAWSPAVDAKNQIPTPMFRLLGQDPVYYYDKTLSYPDTMEPVWATGQSETFVRRFFEMIAKSPTQRVAYAQLGQENSFGWAAMRKAYPMQMERLEGARRGTDLIVETMGETGRRFQRAFRLTPPQAQVMLENPFGDRQPPQRTVWYQSRYYRANLHFRGGEFYLRDLHVYADGYPQPYLTETVRQHGIEQRLLAAMDGYHWSDGAVRAGGRFERVDADGRATPLAASGPVSATESAAGLRTTVPLATGGRFVVTFREREIELALIDVQPKSRLSLEFVWAAGRSAFESVSANRLSYRFRDFAYSIGVANGVVSASRDGVRMVAKAGAALRLEAAQSA
ncbi:MAG: hypothetical protein JSU00_21465 [Acidobacteria bacterium]|nr:hypothetical protein [Acidobacteriota bacterium]